MRESTPAAAWPYAVAEEPVAAAPGLVTLGSEDAPACSGEGCPL
ncbi:hypothetical protein [Sphaerisporangium sp. TRM90804]|nr:hypothetical protein [Sphaerisporangium sp. TRM90804]MDH2427027.1 hypothetical protein [Sphaerisporangium sp. TRM90804]